MQTKLISLIRQAQPSRALFTTFTFSIAWFEAIVVPTLRTCGCKQIDVLVDAREACKSTEDANSLYAGSAYRIIPVYMSGTNVFHPKLAYFEGKSKDALVVGSANLTLAGHGKNLEVLDAVDSSEEPGVFVEFSEFLSTLISRHEFSEENLEILRSYQTRATTVAATGGGSVSSRKAWLVHTIERTAAEQFVEHAARIEGPHRLTVLSPYHSPSGAPIENLARQLEVDQVRIGISAKTFLAPFREPLTNFANPVEFVNAKTPNSSRFLHAKCFEVEGADSVIVMTGSVNATGQSLESTRNVEVSLVRLLDASPFEWESAIPREYVACEFLVSELTAKSPALQATWTTSNHIVGVVQPANGAQVVRFEIWDGDTCHAEIEDVALRDDGTFSIKMKELFNARGALRLQLIGNDLSAVGWINVEFELSADETQRTLAKASTRMLAGEFHPNDLAAIFSWLEGLQPLQPKETDFENN